jgi:hypothetical protein
MKTVPKFYTSNPERVSAYDAKDMDFLTDSAKAAEQIWLNEWIKQGSSDHGTCCGGKGIEIWFVGPRQRVAKTRNLVHCSWVQGNLSASRSVQPAIDFLKSRGIECRYNDGWMD